MDNRFVFWAILIGGGALLAIAGCGEEKPTNAPRRNPVIVTSLPDAKVEIDCNEVLKNQDTDRDGLKDYDEIHGYQCGGAGTVFYSDAEKADTDGDGRNDGAECSNREVITAAGTTPSAQLDQARAMNPAKRDWVARVYLNGMGPNLTNNITWSGWNHFTSIRLKNNATYSIKDLALSTWNGGEGEQNARGNAPNNWGGCFNIWACINNMPYNSLIGMFSSLQSSLARSQASQSGFTTTNSSTVFPLGSLMQVGTLEANTSVTTAADDGRFLLLRGNDSPGNDGGGLNNNRGSIVVLIRESITAYDQAPPTPTIENAIVARLCPH